MIDGLAEINGVAAGLGEDYLDASLLLLPCSKKHPLSTGHGLRMKQCKPGVAGVERGVECMDFPPEVKGNNSGRDFTRTSQWRSHHGETYAS